PECYARVIILPEALIVWSTMAKHGRHRTKYFASRARSRMALPVSRYATHLRDSLLTYSALHAVDFGFRMLITEMIICYALSAGLEARATWQVEKAVAPMSS